MLTKSRCVIKNFIKGLLTVFAIHILKGILFVMFALLCAIYNNILDGVHVGNISVFPVFNFCLHSISSVFTDICFYWIIMTSTIDFNTNYGLIQELQTLEILIFD